MLRSFIKLSQEAFVEIASTFATHRNENVGALCVQVIETCGHVAVRTVV